MSVLPTLMSSIQGQSLSLLSLHLCVCQQPLSSMHWERASSEAILLPHQTQYIFVDDRGNVAGSQEGRSLPVLGSSSSWA